MEGLHYPPDKFNVLTSSQKNKVKDLRSKGHTNSSGDHDTNISKLSIICDEITEIRDAIITSVQKASDASVDSPPDENRNCKSTPSGSVRDFCA